MIRVYSTKKLVLFPPKGAGKTAPFILIPKVIQDVPDWAQGNYTFQVAVNCGVVEIITTRAKQREIELQAAQSVLQKNVAENAANAPEKKVGPARGQRKAAADKSPEATIKKAMMEAAPEVAKEAEDDLSDPDAKDE